jgi:hypothetical protein
MDDEVFIIPYLVFLREQKSHDVSFFYLTKSEGRNQKFNQGIREFESKKMILSILPEARIEFLGRKFDVEDLLLHENIDILFEYLNQELDGTCDQIISPHFEGGHIDHDSSSFLASHLAKKIDAELLTFNLYSARGNYGPLYRVAKAFESPGTALKVGVLRHSYIYMIQIPFIYKSQIRTWIGIYPALFWRILVLRKFSLIQTPSFNANLKPNKGRVLYEKRKDGNFQQWSSTISRFLNSRGD